MNQFKLQNSVEGFWLRQFQNLSIFQKSGQVALISLHHYHLQFIPRLSQVFLTQALIFIEPPEVYRQAVKLAPDKFVAHLLDACAAAECSVNYR